MSRKTRSIIGVISNSTLFNWERIGIVLEKLKYHHCTLFVRFFKDELVGEWCCTSSPSGDSSLTTHSHHNRTVWNAQCVAKIPGALEDRERLLISGHDRFAELAVAEFTPRRDIVHQAPSVPCHAKYHSSQLPLYRRWWHFLSNR